MRIILPDHYRRQQYHANLLDADKCNIVDDLGISILINVTIGKCIVHDVFRDQCIEIGVTIRKCIIFDYIIIIQCIYTNIGECNGTCATIVTAKSNEIHNPINIFSKLNFVSKLK